MTYFKFTDRQLHCSSLFISLPHR